MESFSNECCRTKTKAITTDNRKKEKYPGVPIRTQRKKRSKPLKGREHAATESFCIQLVKRVVRIFWTNHKSKKSKPNSIPGYFQHSTENCSEMSVIMNFIATILLFCEGPENSLLLLNHSDQKENQSQLGST